MREPEDSTAPALSPQPLSPESGERGSDLTDLTARCIRCGFCLEACPTFRVTAAETESPRGRIYLVRSAEEGVVDWQADVREHLDRCLGCLACETACPSGVEYGSILELARDKLERQRPELAKTLLLKGTTSPTLLRTQLAAAKLLPGKRVPGFVSRALSGQRAEAELPQVQKGDYPPLDEGQLSPVRGEVYLLEGCAMRVLFPRVHQATRRLLRRVGYAVREVPQGCCGALHAHNGHLDEAHRMRDTLMTAFDADLPIIVNSAGCGSWLKEGEASGVGREALGRVLDATEFLVEEGLETVLACGKLEARVTYHDACHLAHGQGIRVPPRELLAAIPGLELVSLNESDTCCGSAGIYNLTEPELARRLLERKWANIEATGADIVAMGNPGCHSWIAQAARERDSRVRVMHTLEVLEEALLNRGSGIANLGGG